jgi:demethylmenaquinone methyltransferase/2-methoxy-6-polyprenyl-1,4-benzoquinol methylase
MRQEKETRDSAVLPVTRSKEEAKRLYDRISKFYDYFTGAIQRKYEEMALDQLAVKEGETVLEIGFGTGHCLKRIAQSVGTKGKGYGIDISSGMLEATRRRLEKAHLMDRVELCLGDAADLPFDDNAFDAVFMSFTLELFDTPEIPRVLAEIKRVLKPSCRFGVVSISKENGGSISSRLYEWAHVKWPKFIDCRPIYVERSLIEAGYGTFIKQKIGFLGLPGEIIIAAAGAQ